MKRTIFIMLLLAFFIPTLVSAQAINTSTVAGIDAYCKTVDAVRKAHKNPELVFADTADMNDQKEKWRSFVSEKALEKFREKSETYSIAFNWRKNGKIVASNFTLFSGSGDWAKYVYHYFREDGSLARVESDYRTFNGDFKVVRRRYFDRNGKQIHSSVKYLDLTTGKPKDVGQGVMGDDSKEIDYYKTTRKLPFAHLVK